VIKRTSWRGERSKFIDFFIGEIFRGYFELKFQLREHNHIEQNCKYYFTTTCGLGGGGAVGAASGRPPL
jgi:hypothetical protein